MNTSSACPDAAPTLHMEVFNEAGAPLTARVHLADSQGNVVEPPEVFFRRDYLIVSGSAGLVLPAGTYRYEVEHGPEYAMARGLIQVSSDSISSSHVVLSQIANLAAEGWWSGDLHTHRDPDEMALHVEAEDLHVAPVITWWNAKSYWQDHPRHAEILKTLPNNRLVHVMAGEDERGGGALLYFNQSEPLHISDATREYPSSVVFGQMARKAGAHIDIEKPFWWDVPVWLAFGLCDTIGLANNHMCRDTMYETEAWGKPRDAERLPPPRGNGYWTQEIYYHILNAGLAIPPSAGSAAGVLPNPVGYNRVYVHVGRELTWDAWWENLRAGRSFVTNGPLLRVSANGELPGHVFSNNDPITLDVHLTARDPIPALEVIYNGAVAATVPVFGYDARLSIPVPAGSNGWFLVRAIADVPHTFRFASTAPFYVKREGEPSFISRASCQFFLDWVRERMTNFELEDAAQLERVQGYFRDAEEFWVAQLERAADD